MTEPTELRPWISELRRIHDENFTFDWDGHVRSVNERLQLSGRDQFGLIPGLPPAWFVGDVAAVTPEHWVLVVSLNQARDSDGDSWHLAQNYTRQTFWDHWRWLHRDWWEPKFYRRLLRLASAALGEDVHEEQEASFATTRMVFAELCPYPSESFALSASDLDELVRDDVGFRLAAEVQRVLINEGRPALVILNGTGTLRSFTELYGEDLELRERRYSSISRPEKTLWHEEGRYTTDRWSVPILGIPFLGKPQTHNSYDEVDQLGEMARALVTS